MRRKSLKKKVRVSLLIEESVYEEAKNIIDNISAYVNECLKNAIFSDNSKNRYSVDERLLLMLKQGRFNAKKFKNRDEALLAFQYIADVYNHITMYKNELAEYISALK